jgi:preprotein translocase subunit SecA
MQHAVAALKAHNVYKRDVDYLVKTNEEGKAEVTIIDEFTGRLMFGRRWSDGLHQAVEAKEGVKIENENKTLATITYQNLFRLYPKLSGMTGTAKTEEDEFRKIYALDVVVVPTNKPTIRKDLADVIFKTEEAKLRGIARQILTLYARQQPALVGTRSVEMSERVSDRLRFDRLGLLAQTDLLRDKLESAKIEKEVYNEYSNLLNKKITDLKPSDLVDMSRALGVSTDLKSPENLADLDRILELKREQREYLEEALTHGIPHNILNAKSHEKEAKIISEAGRKGTVTIATNMAGRGVDILLGGTIVNEEEEETTPGEYEYRRGGKPIAGLTPVGERGSEQHQAEANEVRSLGGLFVVGCERHESRRIDNQLRGRSGRQGDPGASRFFVSLEDELMRLFGDRSNNPLMAGWVEHEAIDASLLSSLIARAQKKVEMHYFDQRKHTLDYDDVMNVQREKIYSERRRIINGADLRTTIVDYLIESVVMEVSNYAPSNIGHEEWDLVGLYTSLAQTWPVTDYATQEDLQGKTHEELVEFLSDIAGQAYDDQEKMFQTLMGEEEGLKEIRRYERHITLRAIDRHWMEHLSNMDYLREGIGWRGMSGIDPLVLYKKEAYDMFQIMLGSVQEEVLRVIMATQFVDENGNPRRGHNEPEAELEDVEIEEVEPVTEAESSKAIMNRAVRRKQTKGRGR